MKLVIQPIVEGPGDVQAVPILLRRIAAEIHQIYDLQILKPQQYGGKSGLLTRFDSAIKAAYQKVVQAQGNGAIVVLFDSDDDCPATLAPKLLLQAKAIAHDIPVSVVLAHREFETWFIASADSLGNVLANQIEIPFDPKNKRNAKGWIAAAMSEKYLETQHQPAFTSQFDLHLARANAPSFDKLCRDLEQIFLQLEP